MALELRLSGEETEIGGLLHALDSTPGVRVVRTSGSRPNRRDPGVRVYATVDVTETIRAEEESSAPPPQRATPLPVASGREVER